MKDPEQTDPSGHGHGGEEGETFPRALLGGLVAGQLRQEEQRARWQMVLVTFGLALLALGLPTTRLLGEGPNIVRWTAGETWVHVHLGLMPVVKLLSLLPGLGAERAWFLTAALCWAGTYPVLYRTCRELGSSAPTAMVSSLVGLAAPVVWLAGSLAGPSAPGLLASAVLMRALLGPWRTEQAQTQVSSVDRLPLLWLGASLVNLSLVLLYPAVVWAVLRAPHKASKKASSRSPAIGRLLGAPAILVTLFVLAAWLLPTTLHGREFLRRGWYLITGNAEQPISNTLAYILTLAPSVGVGVVGLWHLGQGLLRRGDADDQAKPAWIWTWCLFPFAVQALLGRPNLDLAALVLGPILTLGLAEWLGRHPQDSRLGPRYLLLGLSQVVILISFAVALGRGDPERSWKRWIRGELVSNDMVLTHSRDHHYLLEQRFGIEAVHLNGASRLPVEQRPAWWAEVGDRVLAASGARRRVLLDQGRVSESRFDRPIQYQEQLDALDLLAPIVRLGWR